MDDYGFDFEDFSSMVGCLGLGSGPDDVRLPIFTVSKAVPSLPKGEPGII
jgi:hypothetical protein